MRTAIVADRLLDGTGTAARARCTVLIDGDTIEAIMPPGTPLPEGVELIDLGDATILPGLIDLQSYCSIDPDRPEPMRQIYGKDHFRRAWATARHMARDIAAGITTVRSMGEGDFLDVETRAAIESGLVAGPEVIPSGYPIAASHSHQSDQAAGGFDGPDAVRAAVRRNVRHGAMWTKVVLTGGLNSRGVDGRTATYTEAEFLAAVEESAALGLPVGAAINGGPAAQLAARTGVDSIEHGSLFGPAEYEALIRHGVPLVLSLGRTFDPDGIEMSAAGNPAILARLAAARAAIRDNLPAAMRSGLKVGLGSDNMHGLLRKDVAALVGLGASPAAAIAAAASGAAAILRRSDIGMVRPGCRADILVVGGDAERSVEALGDIRLVLRAGRKVGP